MKPLFLSVFTVLFTGSLFAQKFEIGINGGIEYNAPIKMTSQYTDVLSQDKPLAYSPAYSVKGIYNNHNWQFGRSLNYGRSSYKTEDFGGCIYGPYSSTGYLWSYKTITGSAPYYPVKLFVNRKISFRKWEAYGGLSSGYIFVPYPLDDMRRIMNSGESATGIVKDIAPFNKNNYYGLSAGLQIGCTYFVTGRLGLNVEMNGDYLIFNQGYTSASYTFTIPVTIGIPTVYKT